MRLADSIRELARRNGDKTAFTFLFDGELSRRRVTYAELDRTAEAYAAFFRSRNLGGERCVIALPSSPEFIFAFFGCLYGGVTAVPAPPVRVRDERSWTRLEALARDCDAAAVVATREIAEARNTIGAGLEHSSRLPWLVPDDVDLNARLAGRESSNCPAFLQYTSGSTAAPRGVVVSHENLMANIQAIGTKLDVRPDSVAVSWLPLHHDMGLIGIVLSGLNFGIELALMPPTYFIQKPIRWLRAISEFGGTHSGGPNFAYDLCLKRISSADCQLLNLSSWRLAFAGAEAVRLETLQRFTAHFADARFGRHAFYPCYGLAEATLIVSGAGERLPVAQRVDRAGLSSDRVAPPAEKSSGVDIVSCGAVIAGHDLAIVAPGTGVALPDGNVGEVWLRGPCVSSGYWNARPDEMACFGNALAGKGGYLRTGDLGFVKGGELYLTGRLKDLIVVYGRKVYPQDVERALESASTSARLGAAIAFADREADREHLVVIQEVFSLGGESADGLIRKLMTAVASSQEVRPDLVLLVPVGAVPKTTSGKLRRGEARAMLARGEFKILAHYQGTERTTKTQAVPFAEAQGN